VTRLASSQELNILADNVRGMLTMASALEWVEGMTWYAAAHEQLKNEVADPNGLALPTVCGVAAALSPGCSWNRCVIDTKTVCATPVETAVVCTYKANLRKALAILRWVYPATVLGRRKAYSFFHNLLYPNTSKLVTIDRHALRVAMNEDEPNQHILDRVNMYPLIGTAYAKAAGDFGLLPSQAQAITWVAYRRLTGVEGRYD